MNSIVIASLDKSGLAISTYHDITTIADCFIPRHVGVLAKTVDFFSTPMNRGAEE